MLEPSRIMIGTRRLFLKRGISGLGYFAIFEIFQGGDRIRPDELLPVTCAGPLFPIFQSYNTSNSGGILDFAIHRVVYPLIHDMMASSDVGFIQSYQGTELKT
jgi:hypothetical protein